MVKHESRDDASDSEEREPLSVLNRYSLTSAVVVERRNRTGEQVAHIEMAERGLVSPDHASVHVNCHGVLEVALLLSPLICPKLKEAISAAAAPVARAVTGTGAK